MDNQLYLVIKEIFVLAVKMVILIYTKRMTLFIKEFIQLKKNIEIHKYNFLKMKI